MTIRGILFDKDGTLLDYAATWLPANRVAALAAARGDAELSRHLLVVGGYDPTEERVAGNAVLAAGSNREIAASWMEHLEGWRHDELTHLLDTIFEEHSGAQSVPVTELRPLLARLRGRALRLGVATNDSRRGAEASLRPFDVLPLLDFLAGYDSGHGFKPEPGMVHAFCVATGLAAAEVMVVGDNLHDMEMGRRAGAGSVVGVLTGNGRRDELAAHADHVIDSILDLEILLETLSPARSADRGLPG